MMVKPPIFYAQEGENNKMLNFLVDAGVHFNNNETLFFFVTCTRRNEIIVYYLVEKGVDYPRRK